LAVDLVGIELHRLRRLLSAKATICADGLLMPTRKDQPPPDLRYFKQTQG
jgi:hypothetical protein